MAQVLRDKLNRPYIGVGCEGLVSTFVRYVLGLVGGIAYDDDVTNAIKGFQAAYKHAFKADEEGYEYDRSDNSAYLYPTGEIDGTTLLALAGCDYSGDVEHAKIKGMEELLGLPATGIYSSELKGVISGYKEAHKLLAPILSQVRYRITRGINLVQVAEESGVVFISARVVGGLTYFISSHPEIYGTEMPSDWSATLTWYDAGGNALGTESLSSSGIAVVAPVGAVLMRFETGASVDDVQLWALQIEQAEEGTAYEPTTYDERSLYFSNRVDVPTFNNMVDVL